MNDERREILRMLADKVISVDEAERLLKALGEGGGARDEEARGRGRARSGLGGALGSIGDALAGIGPMVKGVVEDALSGLNVEWTDDDDGELEEVALADSTFTIAAGTELVIRQRPKRAILRQGGGGIKLIGVAGDQCRVAVEDGSELKVMSGGSRVVILWQRGSLTIDVPATVSSVRAATMGGDVAVDSLGCDVKIRTMGGDLDLQHMRHGFSAKTHGGDVNVILAPEWTGESAAHTMGGDIEIYAPEGLNAEIRAATMGGDIEIEQGLGAVERQDGPGRHKTVTALGAGSGTAVLSAKTMGGDIRIRSLK